MSASDNLSQNYEFNSEQSIWQRPDAASIGYSDGEQLENVIGDLLTKVTDKSVMSNELRSYQRDWPTLYYLSANRSNLLRPLAPKLLKGAKVLELGCGMGAVTRYLGETAQEVYAVEGSQRRGRAAAARCSDLSNVHVIIDEIKALPESLGKFDVVTLIGVLEYARVYGGPGMELEMLKKAKSFLKPDGALILAIENKLGLKYFAGVPEDHLARSWASMTNSYKDNSVTTWSRKELLELLHKAGFASCEQFIPIPDYKLPGTILTPEALTAERSEFNLGAILNYTHRSCEAYPLFNMGEAWQSVIDAGLLPDFADSLCFVARPAENAASAFEAGKLVHHYGNYSSTINQYDKEAVIQRSEGEIQVIRKKANPAINSKAEVYNQVVKNEPYYPGELLIQKVRRVTMRPDWTLEELFKALQPWVDGLRKHADENWQCPGDLLDYTPFNLVEANGEYVPFDLEWTSRKKLSYPYLLYRGLFHTLLRIMPMARSTKHRLTTFSQIFNAFIKTQNLPENIPVSIDYLGWQEVKFFRHIKGNPNHRLGKDFDLRYM